MKPRLPKVAIAKLRDHKAIASKKVYNRKREKDIRQKGRNRGWRPPVLASCAG